MRLRSKPLHMHIHFDCKETKCFVLTRCYVFKIACARVRYMIDVLKGIDRRLGAIFGGDNNDDILEIRSIQKGGVLTTINYREHGEYSWISCYYDVTVLLPFIKIPKNDAYEKMRDKIQDYAEQNKGILECGDGAELGTAEMITIIDIEPHTDIPIIVGKRRFTLEIN